MTEGRLPHAKTLIWLTYAVILCFSGVTFWVLTESDDATIKGAVVGTWTASVTLALGFWFGSSSGGKAKP